MVIDNGGGLRRNRATLARALGLLDEAPVDRGRLRVAEQALHWLLRAGRVPPSYATPLDDARRAIVDLLGSDASVGEARDRVARALDAFDAAVKSCAIEA